MKIVTVIGARPQFIKAAVVSKVIAAQPWLDEIIVHTGQHYDTKMSDVFFEELNIPTPKYNLGIGSASHGKQTARMLEGIEEVILDEKPDALMVYGDTNSTLAGALAASKLHVPVIHVESGLRSYNKLMPEEQNRILTDHVSDILFCPTQTAVDNLKKEGITEGVYNPGDVMLDSVMSCKNIADLRFPFSNLMKGIECYSESENYQRIKAEEIKEKGYYLATIHRAENTDDKKKLGIILESFNSLDNPVLFLVHPRTIKVINETTNSLNYRNIIFAKPVSYFEMLSLSANAKKILTDSGGLQKEAYFLNVPCVTLRDQTEWTETLHGNWNVLTKIDKEIIMHNIMNVNPVSSVLNNKYFGDGFSAAKMIDILKSRFLV